MSTTALDRVDVKILYELDKNARASYSEIGKKVLLSKQSVKKRIDALVSKRVIIGFIIVINMAVFKIMPMQLYILFHPCTEKRKKEFLDYLLCHADVPQVAFCEGLYDAFFGVAGRTQDELDNFLSQMHARFPGLINRQTAVYFVDTKLFTRDYLVNKKRSALSVDRGFHSRKSTPATLKEIDIEILKHLSTDARMYFVDLAKAVRKSVPTIINRYKYMQKNSVIKGTFLMLNTPPFVQHNILIKLKSPTKDVQKRALDYFMHAPHILFVAQLIGEYDFSIITECRDFFEYRELCDDFKSKFSLDLNGFMPLVVLLFPKINFMPSPRSRI